MASKYPYHERPPQTLEDVKEWLTTWLHPSTDYVVEHHGWKQTQWFGIHSAEYGLFEQVGSVGFHVVDSCSVSPTAYDNVPNLGAFSTFEEAVDGAARFICKRWNIPAV